MVTTVVGDFSPYSRTKRFPPAPRPIYNAHERLWLLRGHQLSRSLAIATGRTSQKENFHLPPTPQGSQTRPSFAHTLNTGIVAFGAGLSQGLEKSSSSYLCLESQSLCPGRSQDHGTERRHYDVLVSRAGHPTLDSDRCCLDTMFQVSRASQAQPYQG